MVVPLILQTSKSQNSSDAQHTLRKIADDWFDTIVRSAAGLERDVPFETLFERHAALLDRSMCFFSRLTEFIQDRTIKSSGSDDILQTSTPEAMQRATDALEGVAKYAHEARFAAFSQQCLGMPPPATRLLLTGEIIPELLFDSVDFLPLSMLYPGSHGWIFIYSERLARGMLQTPRFLLTYSSSSAVKTVYGVYRAIAFQQGNMAGPEFMKLDEFVRNSIIKRISGGLAGSESFKLTSEALTLSRRTLPCILLQCLQTPPSRARSVYCPPATLNHRDILSQTASGGLEATWPPPTSLPSHLRSRGFHVPTIPKVNTTRSISRKLGVQSEFPPIGFPMPQEAKNISSSASSLEHVGASNRAGKNATPLSSGLLTQLSNAGIRTRLLGPSPVAHKLNYGADITVPETVATKDGWYDARVSTAKSMSDPPSSIPGAMKQGQNERQDFLTLVRTRHQYLLTNTSSYDQSSPTYTPPSQNGSLGASASHQRLPSTASPICVDRSAQFIRNRDISLHQKIEHGRTIAPPGSRFPAIQDTPCGQWANTNDFN